MLISYVSLFTTLISCSFIFSQFLLHASLNLLLLNSRFCVLSYTWCCYTHRCKSCGWNGQFAESCTVSVTNASSTGKNRSNELRNDTSQFLLISHSYVFFIERELPNHLAIQLFLSNVLLLLLHLMYQPLVV